MESRHVYSAECSREDKVLETLASIKNQVSYVLKHLQEARESAAESAVQTMNSATEPSDAKASLDTSISRDEVKAQREAKKAAKAARKGKSVGESPTDVEQVKTINSVLTDEHKKLDTPSAAAFASSSTNDSTKDGSEKSKAQLKAERRAIQEAQRLAKANATPDKSAKKPGTDKKATANAAPEKSVKTPGGEKKSAEKLSNKSSTSGVIVADMIAQAEQNGKKEQQKPLEHDSTTPRKEVKLEDVQSPSKSVISAETQDSSLNASQASRVFAPDESRIHALFYWGSDTKSINEEFDERKFVDVDPMFRELGMMYSGSVIRGSNQRTIALLKVVKRFVKQYRTPEGKGFKHDLSSKIKICLDKLKFYRPFAVGMTNAVDGLNGAIRHLDEGLPDEEYRELLEEWCDRFIEEKIEKAAEAMAQQGVKKIKDGDTILVFSLTDVIYHVLKLAGEMGRKFQLVLAITSSGTYMQDYKQLKDCMEPEVFQNNVRISCINISSIMSFISSVNKVFLGGHALFTTGGVMAHAGSSMIALCANQHNIPTLFFCETYKFCDKPPTDAFYQDVFLENKICITSVSDRVPDDDEELNESTSNRGERNEEVATAVLRYDVTPVKLVTCVITDIDMLPSSNVSVVLRVQETRPLTRI